MIGPVHGVAVGDEDAILVARLRDGEEGAFEEAVAALYPAMLAVARGYVRTRSVAEEVVQEAWLGVLKGIDRFEGRSTLRTWVLRIVANIARDHAVRVRVELRLIGLARPGVRHPLREHRHDMLALGRE